MTWWFLLPAFAGAREDRALIQSLDSEVKALREKLKLYEESGCDPTAAPDQIYPELVQVLSGQPVKLSRRGATILVTLPASVVFPSDEVRVREEGMAPLDLLATVLNAHREVDVLVVVHTGSAAPPATVRKRYPTNLELSAARAASVGLLLVGRFGVAPARVTVAGRGDAEPLRTNDTPEDASENERVVLELNARSPR